MGRKSMNDDATVDVVEEQTNLTKKKKRKDRHDKVNEVKKGIEVDDEVEQEEHPKKKKKKKHNKDLDIEIDEGSSSKKEKMKRIDRSEDEVDQEETSENQGTQANLTAEKPKKKKKKDKSEKTLKSIEPTVSKSEAALDYLQKWKNNRASWKFQTMRQVWLLQHMYESSLIPDDDFDTVLEYVDSVKGKSRDLTLQKAQTMLQEHETAEGNASETESKDIETEQKKDEDTDKAKGILLKDDEYERVRQIIQLLL